MKIPINWLKEFVKIPSDLNSLSHNLTMVGHMLDKKESVEGDVVIDLELRGNRADCYSIMGIAREAAAIYKQKIKAPKTANLIKASKLEDVSLNIKTPLVKRAMISKITDVKIEKSPDWLAKRLRQYGMESINNIVDLTNYIMIETGEPMHAFDLDKVGQNLEIRLAGKGEKMTTFQGTDLSLTDEDLVWASGPKGGQVLSVAGAIGEKYNSISDSTKNILLEAASYDRANIRKSVYRHNLLTEAGIRHEKDLDPNMVEPAIARFLYFMEKEGWGNCDRLVYDYYPKKVLPKKIGLDFSQLKNLSGLEIPKGEIKKILAGLGFKISNQTKNSLDVEIPTIRTDVVLSEDLIEEILRIYGYDKIPQKVLSLEIPKDVTPSFITQEQILKNAASAVGFNEAITLSFVKSDLGRLNIHPFAAESSAVSLLNPPSPDVKNMRTSLLPNLYESVKKAIHERAEEVDLFEIGKIYYQIRGKYYEKRKIGFSHYSKKSGGFAGFKSLLNSFFVKSGLAIPSYNTEAILAPLADSYEILVGGKAVGWGGETEEIFFAEIDLDSVLDRRQKYKVALWPKYPPQIEDITFDLPEKTKIGGVAEAIKNSSNRISFLELKDIYKNSYTFRIWYQDQEKTMTNREVEQIRKKAISAVKSKFGGTVKD